MRHVKKTGSPYQVKVIVRTTNATIKTKYISGMEHMITFPWNDVKIDLLVASLHGLEFLLLDRVEQASWLSSL